MADRLTLARALEDSGMSSVTADRVASEIYDAIHANVVTKNDLQAAVEALHAKIAALELRLTLRTGVITTAVAGALFTALHYWPPH